MSLTAGIEIARSMAEPWMLPMIMALIPLRFSVSYLRQNLSLHVLSILVIGLFGTGKTFLCTIPTLMLAWRYGGVITDVYINNLGKTLKQVMNLVWS